MLYNDTYAFVPGYYVFISTLSKTTDHAAAAAADDDDDVSSSVRPGSDDSGSASVPRYSMGCTSHEMVQERLECLLEGESSWMLCQRQFERALPSILICSSTYICRYMIYDISIYDIDDVRWQLVLEIEIARFTNLCIHNLLLHDTHVRSIVNDGVATSSMLFRLYRVEFLEFIIARVWLVGWWYAADFDATTVASVF
jgi:hypothetical protein